MDARFGLDDMVESALDFRFGQRSEAKLGASGLDGGNDAVDIVADNAESGIGRVLLDHCHEH